MTDTVNAETRRRMMRGIRSRDTKPELLVRKGLHAKGFRYVLGGRGLPGRPDLVFPSKGAVIFVNGCFWHRHPRCRFAYVPKTRTNFWLTKFEDNVRRDHLQRTQLRKLGWRVITVWECDLRADCERVIEELSLALAEPGEAISKDLPQSRARTSR